MKFTIFTSSHFNHFPPSPEAKTQGMKNMLVSVRELCNEIFVKILSKGIRACAVHLCKKKEHEKRKKKKRLQKQ